MTLASALLLTLLAVPAADDGLPKVTLLPLLGEGEVDADTADGMTALFREALERAEAGAVEAPFLDLLPEGKKDKKRVKACKGKHTCIARIMKRRGSDLLAAGTIKEVEGELIVDLVVFEQGKGVVRTLNEPLAGDDFGLVFDRIARMAFAPGTLAGSLVITGSPEGSEVLVDDQLAGTLPLDGPLLGIPEGLHTVTVRYEGHRPLSKPARVRFRETVTLEFKLSKGIDEPLVAQSPLQRAEAEEDRLLSGVHVWGPSVVGGVAAAVAVAGAVSGAATLAQAILVQQRAEAQQLVFPRDTFMIRSGQVLAVATNALLATSLTLAVGAGGWIGTVALLDVMGGEEEGELRAAPVGAPEAEQERDPSRARPAPAFEVPDEEPEEEPSGALPKGDGRQR